MKIGVLALQGAVSEHLDMLEACDVEAVKVRRKSDLKKIDGLIIPGGESTTIGRLIVKLGLETEILRLKEEGKPLFGTCAGLVLLGSRVEGSEQKLLGLMDTLVVRNGFGRQRESFEDSLAIPSLGEEPFPGVFIRAPYVSRTGAGVEVLAAYRGRIIAARQGKVLAAAFHPELTEDLRLHRYFIEMASKE